MKKEAVRDKIQCIQSIVLLFYKTLIVQLMKRLSEKEKKKKCSVNKKKSYKLHNLGPLNTACHCKKCMSIPHSLKFNMASKV